MLVDLEKQTVNVTSDLDRRTLIEESLKSHFEKNPDDWTFEETKEFVRFVVREIKVTKEGIPKIYTI